jgi:four helix bundle protein
MSSRDTAREESSGRCRSKFSHQADDLFIKLHGVAVNAFPVIERFALGAQLRRAAYSVPANIAEGSARRLLDRS